MSSPNESTGLRKVLLHDLKPVLERYGIPPSFELKESSKPYQYLKDPRTGLEIWISEEVADFELRGRSENCELQDFDDLEHLSRYFLEKLTSALDAGAQQAP